MKRLLRYLQSYKKELILGPLFKLLEAVFELTVPVVMARIIDVGITNRDSAYVLKMSGLIVVLGVCGLCFAITCQYFAARCAYGFGTELRAALYKHICSLSYSGIDRVGTSSLVNRLTNDTNPVPSGVNMFIRLGTRSPFLIIGAAVMAVTINARLALIFFVVAPLISLIIFLIMRRTIPMYKATQKKLDTAAMQTRESLEGARVIRAFSRQKNETEEFGETVDEIAVSSAAVGKISAILNPAAFMIMDLGIVFILWSGGAKVSIGSLTQGELTAFTNYMTQILLALVVFANLIVTFTKALASANRISEVFAIAPEENETALTKGGDGNILEFRNVSFMYDKAGEDSVKNVSFKLRNGDMLGIIGGTGSGKSTLARLIPCFYRATSGEVLVSGVNVNDCELDALRRRIGIVPQKAVLFSGTVRDNMKWRRQDATDAEIIEALKTAQAWDFVSSKPDGLDSFISQGGRNFSGGQRQRLSIARALVGCPDILILDDPTSALDYATDLALRRAIKEKMSETTVIMITQRATSVMDADRIIVMDDGECVGSGTHSELIESCPVYREIYDSQINSREDGNNA